jgi:nucleoside-diphosphate-sugar epimerase
MKVLVTGAGGNLGRATVPALKDAGHEPIAFDFRPIETDAAFVQGDVRDRDAVASAIEGCDAVVHAAALHGIHVAHWSPRDFFAINVEGSFNVFEAARERGIDRVVFASTMGVYGKSLEAPADRWAWVHEGLPTLPTDIYGTSKVMAEELGRMHGRTGAMRVVALRFGMYVPASFEHYGFRLLFGGVDERDVAQSVLLSLEHEPDGGFEAFDIFADTPFEPEDARAMHEDPLAVIERYWPGANDLFRENGIDPLEHIWARFLWPIDEAKRRLGYRPRWGFAEFLDAVRENDRSRYPFLDLPHWGVPPSDET